MEDRREKRLSSSDSRMKKMLDELDPDMLQYFDDIRKPKKLKRKEEIVKNFKIGDIVCVGNSYGTVIYGPYVSENKKTKYEIEMESGEILSVIDNGKNITKYSHMDNQEDDREEDF